MLCFFFHVLNYISVLFSVLVSWVFVLFLGDFVFKVGPRHRVLSGIPKGKEAVMGVRRKNVC